MTEPGVLRGANWYLLQTKPRQEFRALEQLQNQQYICFLPTLCLERVQRGKAKIVVEPLFWRYLFVQLDVLSSNWAALRSTRGVSKLVAFGGHIATISETIIEGLRNARQHYPIPLFEKGEKVIIQSGPFAGLEGVYQMTDGNARATVLLELISQPQKLVFALNMLSKAA